MAQRAEKRETLEYSMHAKRLISFSAQSGCQKSGREWVRKRSLPFIAQR